MYDEAKLNNAAEQGDSFMNATGKLEYTLTNDYLFHVVMHKSHGDRFPDSNPDPIR